jgi:hypothetical protein
MEELSVFGRLAIYEFERGADTQEPNRFLAVSILGKLAT